MLREEHIFHYLDDFAVVVPPDSDTCMLYLHKLKSISDHTAGDYY